MVRLKQSSHLFLLVVASVLTVVLADGSLPECPPQSSNSSDSIYFPNPDNCSTYYQCSNGVPIMQSCPPDLLFNMATRTCDFASSVQCVQSTNLVYYPVNCTKSPLMANPTDCSTFLICAPKQYAIVMRCPADLLFNPTALVCDYPYNVPCGSQS